MHSVQGTTVQFSHLMESDGHWICGGNSWVTYLHFGAYDTMSFMCTCIMVGWLVGWSVGWLLFNVDQYTSLLNNIDDTLSI